VPRLVVGAAGGYETALARASPKPPRVAGASRIVTHTSGTTGKPKGAEREVGRSGLSTAIRFVEKVPLHVSDRWLLAAPLFHQFGQGMASIGLVLGTTLVLPRKFDADRVLDMGRAEDVTDAVLVPVMLKRMLAAADPTPPPNLRAVVLSGSPLPPSLRERTEEVYDRVFYDLYGSTEVGWATIATPEDQLARPGTVGAPGRGMRVIAADDEGRVRPPGEVGRLYVETGFEFEGYTGMGLGDDRRVVDGAVEFGDTGWVDEDGYVFLAGRADDMIVSGGENVYPGEVEEVLEAHEGIADVAVVGVPDDEYGEVLHAVVVPAAGAELTAEGVREHVKGRLARYKAPKHVTVTDEIPRTAVGKVRKDALPAAPAS
jgi:fatty-acyl-CoA synthase